ncbi:MAG: pyrroline-5-carboxylate reductase family protein, partial [Nitrospinales bacterium]
MLKSKKLGFLGAGNMAEAIIKGLLSASFIEAKSILAADPVRARLDVLRHDYKIKVTEDNREVAEKCDIVVLAVKPQMAGKVLNEVHDLMDRGKLLISIAAGITIGAMEGILNAGNKKAAVVRTMPNTPALVQEAATAIASGSHVTQEETRIAHRIFEAVGKTVDVDEDLLNAVTGLSGSGPA